MIYPKRRGRLIEEMLSQKEVKGFQPVYWPEQKEQFEMQNRLLTNRDKNGHSNYTYGHHYIRYRNGLPKRFATYGVYVNEVTCRKKSWLRDKTFS